MSGRGVTEQDLGALAYLARRLREETHGCAPWDEPGIKPAVNEMRNWNLATAVEQVLRRGTDPEARTPKAMLHPSSSARLPSEKPNAGPPPVRQECPKHVGQDRPPFCSVCASEPYAQQVPEVDPGIPPVTAVNPNLAKRLADRLGGA